MRKGFIRKKYLLRIFSLIIFLTLIFSIDAAITIVAPANNTNFTGAFGPLRTFNVSYINGTDFTDATNATFYYNLSGIWTKIGSTLICKGAPSGSPASCNASLNISGLTNGRYSINATLSNTTTGSSNTNASGASVITINITFDSTPPNVSFAFQNNTINNGNYSGIIILNVSANDPLMGIGSVYFNITNSTNKQVNFTKASGSGSYYNLTLNTSKFPDGKYNITVYANDSLLNNLNNSEIIQVTFDNTPPIIFPSNISLPSGDYYNYSGTILLNTTVIDSTSGVSSVLFNITNTSGIQVAAYDASQTSTNYWTSSFSTSTLGDGIYNITIQTTDYSGNKNFSAQRLNILFDNTPPVISFSCSPIRVYIGYPVTCSCTGADALSGIATTTFNSNPTINEVGAFTETCTVVDVLGNSGNSIFSYNVDLLTGSALPSSTAATLTNNSNTNITTNTTNPETTNTGQENSLFGISYLIWGILIIVIIAIVAFFILGKKRIKKLFSGKKK